VRPAFLYLGRRTLPWSSSTGLTAGLPKREGNEELLLHVRALAALRAILAEGTRALAIRAILAAVFRAAGAGLAESRIIGHGRLLTDDSGRKQSGANNETAKQFDDHEKLTFLEWM
jgi:hypothetical protein